MKNKKSENDKRIIAISILVIFLFLGVLIFSVGWLVKEVGETTSIPEVTTSNDKFNLTQAAELNIGGVQPTEVQPATPAPIQPTNQVTNPAASTQVQTPAPTQVKTQQTTPPVMPEALQPNPTQPAGSESVPAKSAI